MSVTAVEQGKVDATARIAPYEWEQQKRRQNFRYPFGMNTIAWTFAPGQPKIVARARPYRFLVRKCLVEIRNRERNAQYV
jgi:hypothetical protein